MKTNNRPACYRCGAELKKFGQVVKRGGLTSIRIIWRHPGRCAPIGGANPRRKP